MMRPFISSLGRWTMVAVMSLLVESVDVVEPQPDGSLLLVNIFGQQKTVKAKLKLMNLVNHKIIFEPDQSFEKQGLTP